MPPPHATTVFRWQENGGYAAWVTAESRRAACEIAKQMWSENRSSLALQHGGRPSSARTACLVPARPLCVICEYKTFHLTMPRAAAIIDRR